MDWGHLPGNMPHAPEDYEVGMLLSQLTDATGLFASGSPPKQGFAARLQNAVKKGPIRTLPDRWPGCVSA